MHDPTIDVVLSLSGMKERIGLHSTVRAALRSRDTTALESIVKDSNRW